MKTHLLVQWHSQDFLMGEVSEGGASGHRRLLEIWGRSYLEARGLEAKPPAAGGKGTLGNF